MPSYTKEVENFARKPTNELLEMAFKARVEVAVDPRGRIIVGRSKEFYHMQFAGLTVSFSPPDVVFGYSDDRRQDEIWNPDKYHGASTDISPQAFTWLARVRLGLGEPRVGHLRIKGHTLLLENTQGDGYHQLGDDLPSIYGGVRHPFMQSLETCATLTRGGLIIAELVKRGQKPPFGEIIGRESLPNIVAALACASGKIPEVITAVDSRFGITEEA